MQISDYLSLFSVEDLRTLAHRRGVRLPEAALRARQMLVRSLSAALSRQNNTFQIACGLNLGEVEVLRRVLSSGRSPGLSSLAEEMGADPARVREVLDSLRLWGLLFPEGDWEHLAIPPATRIALHYLPAQSASVAPLSPPALEASRAECHPRPGFLSGDLAEFLARIARMRPKLTQARKINRRDLKSMESGFAIATPGYPSFISWLATALNLLAYGDDLLLRVSSSAESWLAQPEAKRGYLAADAWLSMRGFAESAHADPAEAEFIPFSLPVQRSSALSRLADLDPSASYSLAAFQERLAWSAPLAFESRDILARNLRLVVTRLLRSLYWLGLVALDQPDQPEHLQLTPLGVAVCQPEKEAALIPEEQQFFLQPNAEAFAPPNLSPRTLFHLRRLTGEKKGGPQGVYPLTQESLRRAMDVGITAEAICTFLERYSRTGLPANVRTLVETVGRQHGRIRLVPTGYVLVADDPALLEELRHLKTVAPMIGRSVTDNVACVSEAHVPTLLRQLRQRGYAPLNESEVGRELDLPKDPNEQPPPLPSRRESAEALGEWSEWLDEDSLFPNPPSPGEPVYGREHIRDLLEEAEECGFEVEIEYHGRASGETTVRTVQPFHLDGNLLEAYCLLRDDTRVFDINRIAWARFTGEVFANE
jgi:hypothetical protein